MNPNSNRIVKITTLHLGIVAN